MTQYTAKKSYVIDADGSYVVPYVNPADTNNLGVVKPDGVTITAAADGTISTNNGNLRAITAYANEGELLTDAQGLSDITNYAHSTYCGDQPSNASPLDPKKFTLTTNWAGTITNDGIASGFSTASFLKVPTIDFTKAWEIEFVIDGLNPTTLASFGANCLNLNTFATTGGFTYTFYLSSNGSDWDIASEVTTSLLIAENTQNKIKLGWDKIEYYYIVNGTKTTIATSSTALYNSNSNIVIGANRNASASDINGKINLKQFSITVDGVPVFSGNKTGIDTIKPVDFTAITSGQDSPFVNPSLPFSDNGLTITDDGIITNWNFNNKVTYGNINGGGSTNYEIHHRLLTPQHTFTSDLSYTQPLYLSNAGSNNWILEFYTEARTSLNLYQGGYNYISLANSASVDYMDIVIKNDGTSFKVSVYRPNGTLINTRTSTKSGTSMPIESLTIYTCNNSYFGAGTPLYQIDMNCMKVIIDGSLVYQPCLKIPYTESKTGSKIVNAIYRDRVNDMASQFGYAPYYTLSDTDFTLPQVELYGNIQQTLRNSTISGINKNYLYSNRMQIQTGSCTSGVEVTLPTPFSDSNYALTVPYSAKSATAFTPTATGDWIAIGLGNL